MKTGITVCSVPLLFILLFAIQGLFAATDLEVMYIERTPKYNSYQTRVLYGGRNFTDDFTPYYSTYAYGLSGQDSSTKRWPDPGETVTFIAHFRNRGSTTISSFNYSWEMDGGVISSGSYNTPFEPFEQGTLSVTWSWEWAEHELEFIAQLAGDSRPSNNRLKIYTNSIGLYTFIDAYFDERFKNATPGYPNASTDSIIEWLQLHCTKMNDMFIEAGSTHRWRYDRLDIVNDYPAPLPSFDRTNYDGAFPERYYVDTTYNDPPSVSAYYHSAEDIDYGLLHEIGHQHGIIDIYQLNIAPSQNQVNGMGYSAMPCLFNGISRFISEHTALAMSHWHGKRRGYFGQYLFAIPTVNKLWLLDSDGQPLTGANVTIYQKITYNNVDHIPNIPKFIGTTNDDGIYVIPNVSLGFKHLFWTDIGDNLNDNPFGYIWCIGKNGLFLIKIEKGGAVDYQWLDVLEFNITYWKGNTAEAIYTRNTSIGREMQFAPPTDCAELNVENWDTWAQGASAEVFNDTVRKLVGQGSIRMETDGGFDTYVRYPRGIIAHWDLSNSTHFNVSFYAENPNLGFQNNSPWIRLGNWNGSYYQYQGNTEILNQARNQWRNYSIPLTGDSTWNKTQVGIPDLTDINFIEIHADTWGYGFKLWVDGVSFTPQPVPLDTDGDSLPDFWELVFFEHLGYGANDDPDDDGKTNIEELLAGTDPSDRNSFFAVTSVEPLYGTPDGMQITWSTVSSRKYRVYYSDDPFGGSMTWFPCSPEIEGTGSAGVFIDSGGDGRLSPFHHAVVHRHYQVKVWK